MLLYYTNVLYYTIEETVKLTLRLTKQIINNFLMCKKGATSTEYWGLVNKKLCPQLNLEYKRQVYNIQLQFKRMWFVFA